MRIGMLMAAWFFLTGNVVFGVACLLGSVVAALIDGDDDLED